jgi:hypothetical protein
VIKKGLSAYNAAKHHGVVGLSFFRRNMPVIIGGDATIESGPFSSQTSSTVAARHWIERLVSSAQCLG